jgi:acyl-CoA dehydrogenase
MELLSLAASLAQRAEWLDPLLIGEIRSCFAMSEPDAASSDARNIRTTIGREGDSYVINGRKWFTTGALHPNCRLAIVMGVTDEHREPDSLERHSMVLVPMNTPGWRIIRNIPIMNYHSPEGHCELLFQNVRIPVSNLLGQEGQGFRRAQDRLGPGRVHHCMRAIGQCEVALDLMCERALERKAFGKHLAEFANIRDWIAESRVEIDQARLLVLRAAHRMDRQGNAAARVDVSAIKLVAARLQTRIVDRAIQVFGAMGLTSDTRYPISGRGAVRCASSTDRMKSTWVSCRDLNFQGRNAIWSKLRIFHTSLLPRSGMNPAAQLKLNLHRRIDPVRFIM